MTIFFYTVIAFTVVIIVVFIISATIFTVIIKNITGNLWGHKYFWNDTMYLPWGKNAEMNLLVM